MAIVEQENPLVEGLERTPVHPTTLIIFGGAGDLAQRKLVPAVYNLAHEGALPERFNMIGTARRDMPYEDFSNFARESITKYSRRHPDDKVLSSLLSRIRYVGAPFDDPKGYDEIARLAGEMDDEAGLPFNRIFYLATAPGFFETLAESLGANGLDQRQSAEVRLVVEKPFGRDLASAQALNRALLSVFEERQIYRIDHYLGKETVQNLLVLRFGNGIFEPLWNRNYVDHVQITASETLGVERRGGFYETAGALRDMIQSHVLQLTSLVAVEPPAAFDATAVRNEKLKVLQSIRPFNLEMVAQSVVRGQYAPGRIGDQPVPGYREEPGVKPTSKTETFVAAKLLIDNWRWAGVPFYIRTGKRLEI